MKATTARCELLVIGNVVNFFAGPPDRHNIGMLSRSRLVMWDLHGTSRSRTEIDVATRVGIICMLLFCFGCWQHKRIVDGQTILASAHPVANEIG